MRMPELRAALVMVPPLLTDLITATLIPRLAASGLQLLVFTVPAAAAPSTITSGFTAADLAILGPGAGARAIAGTLFSPATPMLALSADLSRLLGPAPGESAPFTPEILAERLRDLAKI
jgi:hypothetical protein